MNDRDTNADTAGAIDPNRPWITDPRDAPANMNWVETLTNPSGVTSRVHFTRAWTGLFFLRLIYFVGTATAAAVFATAGSSFSVPNWVWPLLVIVTAVMSLILHVRRLADAQRSAIWASLVLLPVIVGSAGFLGGVAMGGAQYDQLVAQREARAIEIPAPEVPAEAAPTTAEAGAGDDEEQSEQSGQRGPQVDVTEVSQRQHALNTGFGLAQTAWAPFAFFVMLWSLLWVGRLPTGGGTIKSRFEDQAS